MNLKILIITLFAMFSFGTVSFADNYVFDSQNIILADAHGESADEVVESTPADCE